MLLRQARFFQGNTAQFQVVERAGKFWRNTPPEL